MSYPMTYHRVIHRNGVAGDYAVGVPNSALSALAGDLRRLEADQRDAEHLARYAAVAEITPAQARVVLDTFFAGCPSCPY